MARSKMWTTIQPDGFDRTAVSRRAQRQSSSIDLKLLLSFPETLGKDDGTPNPCRRDLALLRRRRDSRLDLGAIWTFSQTLEFSDPVSYRGTWLRGQASRQLKKSKHQKIRGYAHHESDDMYAAIDSCIMDQHARVATYRRCDDATIDSRALPAMASSSFFITLGAPQSHSHILFAIPIPHALTDPI